MIAGHIIALTYNLSIFKESVDSEGKMTDAKVYYCPSGTFFIWSIWLQFDLCLYFQ